MAIEIRGMTPLINVFEMPTSLRFYRDVLGFEVVTDSGNGDDSSWVWLRLNGSDLMLSTSRDTFRLRRWPNEQNGITTLASISVVLTRMPHMNI